MTDDLTIVGNGETELEFTEPWNEECAILVDKGVTLTISGVKFVGNGNMEKGNKGLVIGTYAGSAEAALGNGAIVNITDCEFVDCEAGIYINAGEGTISNNTFKDCYAGISIDQLSGELEIADNNFSGCEKNVSANPSTEKLLTSDVAVDFWKV